MKRYGTAIVLAAAALCISASAAPMPVASTSLARKVYAGFEDYLRLFGEHPLAALPAGSPKIERLIIQHPFGGATVIRIATSRRDAAVTVSMKPYSLEVKGPRNAIQRRSWHVPLARLRTIDVLARRTDFWSGTYPYREREDDDICIDSTWAVFERLTPRGYDAVDTGACHMGEDEEKVFSAWLDVARIEIQEGGSYRFK